MHHARYSLCSDTPQLVLDSVFQKYDKDDNKGLDLHEFQRALSDLAVTDEHEQEVLFHLADHDNGGTIDVKEFVDLIKDHEFDELLSDHDQMEFLWKTWGYFEQYDADGDGEIAWEEFWHYLSKHGYTLEHISAHWHWLDTSKDGTITFDEFWKGYKAMAEANRRKEVLDAQAKHRRELLDAQEKKEEKGMDDDEIVRNVEKFKKDKRRSRTIDIDMTELDDDTNLLDAVRAKLKSTEQIVHPEFELKLGKVLESKTMSVSRSQSAPIAPNGSGLNGADDADDEKEEVK